MGFFQQPAERMPLELPLVLEYAWDHLTRACSDREHGFHLPVLTTLDGSGGPEARTVVLRLAMPAERCLVAHTDVRAPKVAHIMADRRVSWCFYDRARGLQVRCQGIAIVERTGSLADARWTASSVHSRRCYLAPRPPSEPADAPTHNLPEELRERAPTHDESELGRTNFGVIASFVHQLELLKLHHNGHLRARFTWNDAGLCDGGQWLAP